MGQLIDFKSPHNKFGSTSNKRSLDLVEMIPYLKLMSGQTFVIKIHYDDVIDDDILYKICKEILVLKHLDINPVLVLDVDKEIKILKDSYNLVDHTANALNLEQFDETVVGVLKNNILKTLAKKISKTISTLGGSSVVLSGEDSDIVYIDNQIEEIQKKQDLYNTIHFANFKSTIQTKIVINSNVLEEISKTKLIPVVTPFCCNKNNDLFVLSSDFFTLLLAETLAANSVMLNHRFESDILKKSIYSVHYMDQINNSITNESDDALKKMLNIVINSVKSGVQYVYMVRPDRYSMIEELCLVSPNGLIIYNEDTNDIEL